MKKHFFFTIALLLSADILIAMPENINTPENFPDENFRAMVEMFMGVGPGGTFTAEEVAAKSGRFDCKYCGISDITGIEFFTGLDEFLCGYNELTSIESLVANEGLTNIGRDAPGHYDDTFEEGYEGDVVDVRYNRLGADDWGDVQILLERLGTPMLYGPPQMGAILFWGLAYSPQKGMDPYEFLNTAENFPDPNFRAFVEGFTGVGPGEGFTAEEAAAKTGMFNCSECNISDMTGIEYFTGIDFLFCFKNGITSLDTSTLANLVALNCSSNQLADLDVSKNTELQMLRCTTNHIKHLNVSGAVNLVELDCSDNELDDLASLVANEGIGEGDVVDIRNNLLDYDDWGDIEALLERIGEATYSGPPPGVIESGLLYSPQKGYDPYKGPTAVRDWVLW